MGVGYLSFEGRSGEEDRASWGLALEAAGLIPLDDMLSVRLKVGWTLSHFSRSAQMIDAGQSTFHWTVNAYRSVGHWVERGKDETFLLRLMAGLFAWTGLSLGFMASGLVFLISPLGATSIVDLGATLQATLLQGRAGSLFCEVGPGLGLFLPPGEAPATVGFGPRLGVGYRFQRMGLSAQGIWSPAALQLDSGDSPRTVVGAALLLYVHD